MFVYDICIVLQNYKDVRYNETLKYAWIQEILLKNKFVSVLYVNLLT